MVRHTLEEERLQPLAERHHIRVTGNGGANDDGNRGSRCASVRYAIDGVYRWVSGVLRTAERIVAVDRSCVRDREVKVTVDAGSDAETPDEVLGVVNVMAVGL